MTNFDDAILTYLSTLDRSARAFAAHYADHVHAGRTGWVSTGWASPARTRAKIVRVIDALDAQCQQEETDAVTAAEDAVEAGQLRWSETGSTRK